MAIVDASGDVENGYTYDVYGEPTVTGSLANEFDFAGQQTDGSTGLQYLRARYYDPDRLRDTRTVGMTTRTTFTWTINSGLPAVYRPLILNACFAAPAKDPLRHS